MSEADVERLYDGLQALESKWRFAAAYPVHKRLRLDAPATDIYDWIVARVRPTPGSTILDAGCGVGFGAIRMARHGNCEVTGVGLSRREIARARAAAALAGVGARTRFLRRSFDETGPEAFDLIVAVESLKHSTDIGRSLAALSGGLKPSGRLVIVEDLHLGPAGDRHAQSLIRDWGLQALHRESDYVERLGRRHCEVVDLTGRVCTASRVRLLAAQAVLRALPGIVGIGSNAALSAFRGGLHLSALYSKGAMTYKAILFRKQ